MLRAIKKFAYFPIASYFSFWAGLQLKKWKPYVILVTGSSGKTTLLHLIEAQIGKKAHYSHHANSSFGVPFDILGLKRKTLLKREWIMLFLRAPLRAFKRPYKQRLYVVEADSDRPGEGAFLSSLLQPNITLWLHSGSSHSTNFDYLVKNGQFDSTEKAIAYELSSFIRKTKDLIITDSRNPHIAPYAQEVVATVKTIFDLAGEMKPKVQVKHDSILFQTQEKVYSIPGFFPEEIFGSIQAVEKLCSYLKLPFDPLFKDFKLPPGRGSIFQGIKGTTIIDSSYNSSPESVSALLDLYKAYPSEKKWIILGDMLELGDQEEARHQELAEILNAFPYDKLILVGPRLMKFTLPYLTKTDKIRAYDKPKDALLDLQDSLGKGQSLNASLLFKGARFLEGIIEHILANPKDVQKLCRREQVWQRRRKQWGL